MEPLGISFVTVELISKIPLILLIILIPIPGVRVFCLEANTFGFKLDIFIVLFAILLPVIPDGIEDSGKAPDNLLESNDNILSDVITPVPIKAAELITPAASFADVITPSCILLPITALSAILAVVIAESTNLSPDTPKYCILLPVIVPSTIFDAIIVLSVITVPLNEPTILLAEILPDILEPSIALS